MSEKINRKIPRKTDYKRRMNVRMDKHKFIGPSLLGVQSLMLEEYYYVLLIEAVFRDVCFRI